MLQLHFRHPDSGALEVLCVHQPVVQLVAYAAHEVLPALQALQDWQARGFGAAGYLAYEAAAGLAPTTNASTTEEAPENAAKPGPALLWFLVFAPECLHTATDEPPALATSAAADFALAPWQAAQSQAEFTQAITRIKAAIAAGQTYQVNYTLPFSSRLQGSADALYAAMRQAQRAPYAAHLELEDGSSILSASPELFFHWQGQKNGGHIVTQPMKGTRPRGLWNAADTALAQELQRSSKDRAENVMIVDLLRNDLGRIAQTGSVQVAELFAIERYPSVWQMTSCIRAQTRPEIDLCQVLQALFPCGSITGAPKHQTMQLIEQLEATPRGVYCGSIGLLRPDGSATFSVAIRTLTLAAEDGQGERGSRPARYHAGAGITWSSEAEAEWQEVLAKTRVVQQDFLRQQATPPFALIETLLWTGREWAWLAGHQKRLAASAAYFAYPFDASAWQKALHTAIASTPDNPQRVRALLHADGRMELSSTPLPVQPAPTWLPAPTAATATTPLRFCLAAHATLRRTPWLYHKTTERSVYERAKQDPNVQAAAVFDVLLHNEEGELCEFTIGNLLLQLGGKIYTPPISSGLLPGVLRAELLAQGLVQERVLYIADLARAEGIWLINSVRGWVAMAACKTG